MTNFRIQELQLEGLKLITPFYIEDSRGYFQSVGAGRRHTGGF